MRPPLMTTNLSLPNRRSGKVRDIYSAKLGSGAPDALIVATDRVWLRDTTLDLYNLETLVKDRRWNKTPPGPALPADVVQNSLARYLKAYCRLTGFAIDLERF